MAKDDDDKPERKRTDERAGSRGEAGEVAEVRAVVDRVEGDVAVLSLGDGKETLDLPLSRLPAGTADGDHLRLAFDGEPGADTLARITKDEGARGAAEERVRLLRERLERRGGAAGKKDFKL